MTVSHSISIYDWHSENIKDDETNDNQFKIFIFGKNQSNESVCVVADNFTPYLYLKTPNHWKKDNCNKFIKKLHNSYLQKQNINYHFIIEKRKVFKGFQNNKKFYCIRLTFENTFDMRKTINIFEKKSFQLEIVKENNEKIIGYTKCYNYDNIEEFELYNIATQQTIKIYNHECKRITLIKKRTEPNYNVKYLGLLPNEKIELYESNIDPILRFLHIQDLEPCCQISIPETSKLKTPIFSYCKHEYLIDWDKIEVDKLSKKKDFGLKIMLFDIECNSSHGDFPQAIKDWTKTVKEILKYSRKHTITFDFLEEMFETIIHKDYNRISRIYLKENRKDIYKSILTQEASQEIIRILHLVKLVEEIIHSKSNILVLKQDLQNQMNLDLDDSMGSLSQYFKIFEKLYFKSIEKNLIESHGDTLSLEYKSSKNPLTHAENYLIDYLNSYFKHPLKNESIIRGDEVIQIGSCFIRQGERECYKKNIITLDSCDRFDEDTEIIDFKLSKKQKQENCIDQVEVKVLMAWYNLIMDEDPDLITGFNIFDFDIPYLFERAKELNILDRFSEISRIRDKMCILKHKGGKLNTKFVDIPGRIQFDLYKVVKEHSLSSYKLDAVSNHFIRGLIQSLQENTFIVDNTHGLKIGNYIKIKRKLGYEELVVGKNEKYEILNVSPKSITLKIDKDDKELHTLNDFNGLYWSLGKDDVSAKDIFRLQRLKSKDRAIVAKYCMMDVVLCVELMNKLKVVGNNIGMSNVCSTPLSWIFTRGQGIKILSLVSKECRKAKFILPTLYPDSYDDSGYEGACVLHAYSGIYFKPIVTLDYASLYPRSMIMGNLSHETIVLDTMYKGQDGAKILNDMGYEFYDVEFENFTYKNDKKISTGKSNERFVKNKNGEKGIIPIILGKLLEQRQNTRNKIKYKSIEYQEQDQFIVIQGKIKNKTDEIIELQDEYQNIHTIETSKIIRQQDAYSDFEKNILDCYQLAYKLVANSIYGQIGAKTSHIFFKQIAASTTAIGRDQLLIAKDYVEKHYPGSKVVYGDTDSVFIDFNSKPLEKDEENIQKAIDLGKEAAEGISKILLKPQDLEYEKVFYPFILLSKKKYVGNKYEENPRKYKQTSMGIVLKRRDNSPLLKLIYGTIIDTIMKTKNIDNAIDFLRLSLRKVINGEYDLDKFLITKTLNDNYKNPGMIAHNVLAERIEKRTGKKPQISDRIGFIYIENPNKNCLQGEKIETKEFILENKLKIDYDFYITNQIMKPVCQIFALVIEQLPGFRKEKDYYQKMEKSLIDKKIDLEKRTTKIRTDKQRLTENIIFYDIRRFSENKKNNTNEITKWFKIQK